MTLTTTKTIDNSKDVRWYDSYTPILLIHTNKIPLSQVFCSRTFVQLFDGSMKTCPFTNVSTNFITASQQILWLVEIFVESWNFIVMLYTCVDCLICTLVRRYDWRKQDGHDITFEELAQTQFILTTKNFLLDRVKLGIKSTI